MSTKRKYIVAISPHYWPIRIGKDWATMSHEQRAGLVNQEYDRLDKILQEEGPTSIFCPLDMEGSPTISVKCYEDKAEREEHIEHVGRLYEDLKDRLNNLVADLQLNATGRYPVPVNTQITELFLQLRAFRDLACK